MSRFRLPFLLGLLGCGLLALSACQQNPRLERTGNPGEIWVEGNFSSGLQVDGIFNADGTLGRSPFLGQYFPGTRVKLMDLRSIESPSGFAHVQASVENPGNERRRIQYRFLWYDANGMERDQGTSGWVSETIESKELRTLEGVARSPEAVRFKLFIRTYTPKK